MGRREINPAAEAAAAVWFVEREKLAKIGESSWAKTGAGCVRSGGGGGGGGGGESSRQIDRAKREGGRGKREGDV